MLSEKEIMAGEIVKLRDQLEEIGRGRNGQPDGQTSEGISYNPNNPYVLQRKIGRYLYLDSVVARILSGHRSLWKETCY